jgi:hypothetical protein
MVFEVLHYEPIDGGGARPVRHNLNDLPLMDRRYAHKLDPDELRRVLIQLAVPGVTQNSGRQDNLLQYSRYLKSQPVQP